MSSSDGLLLPSPSCLLTLRRFCASAFSSLSCEPLVRYRMIDQGVFTAIIALSTTSSRSVKAACCRALCNLCCFEGSEYRAVKEGAPYALVQISSICPENILICLTTLLNLSCVTDKYARIEEVTDALLHFFSMPISEEEQILILSAFCNLSSLRNNQLRLVEDGILRVVEKSAKSTSIPLRAIASKILRNLTSDARTRGKLMDQYVLTTLMNMARDDVETVRMSCVHAFYNLSRDNACREKIVTGNAVGVIIRMSIEKMSNVDMGRTAAKTLRILCGDKVLANKLVGDGIVKALMSLIRTDDGLIRKYCAESICSLFQNESVLARLIEQGAVNVVVSLSQNDFDEVTGQLCAFALFQLSSSDLCPVHLMANGILPCLIRLCQSPSTKTKRFCGAALWSMTIKKRMDSSGAYVKSLDVSSAIPVLVHMLRTEDEEAIKVDCASALYNLADVDDNCDSMLHAGALIPVVNLTKRDYLQTKIKCAAILSRLSCHDKYYREFASEPVLEVLLKLSCLEHALTQRRVVIAVSNLSQFPELRTMLLKLRATEYIISLASKPDEHIRRGCAAIICNMSFEEGSEAAMIKAGVVSTLLITALVTSDQLQTKLICAKALVNLMYDPQSYAKMVEERVIWGLGNLTRLDDTDILNMCAKALCNLSCDYARQMLSSSSTVTSIMKLITQEGNVELQRYSGRILTNILMQTDDSDEKFRKEAVLNLVNMSKCKDKEVSELCIYCLCLASQSESCREDIVSSGVLKNIDVSSIFNDPSVSYAYLTMFGNIANNPKMRIKVLDDSSIDRFRAICNLHHSNLDIAVINALYCLSCATENLQRLVHQHALEIIEIIWNTDHSLSGETIHHIAAFMFNLTTDYLMLGLLVSQGIVRLLVALWEHAKLKLRTATLVIAAICQLSAGNVNSAQMVREGCTEILCFVSFAHKEEAYSSYRFDHELVERCSAAFRNLCISIPNQVQMVQSGAIDAIVGLISLNGESLDAPDFATTRRNCASALRSMTYNTTIRLMLVQSGAIRVILQDLKRNFAPGELQMNMDLLCELEAESWCNGSRGQQKEGRAGYLEPMPLYTRLLGGISNVDLNIGMKSADRKKYLVKIDLQEPPIETSGARQALEDGFQDLVHYPDDDILVPETMEYPKIGLPEEEAQVAPIEFVRSQQELFARGARKGSRYQAPLAGCLEDIEDDDTSGNEHRSDSIAGAPPPSRGADRGAASAGDALSTSLVSSVYSSSHDTVTSKGSSLPLLSPSPHLSSASLLRKVRKDRENTSRAAPEGSGSLFASVHSASSPGLGSDSKSRLPSLAKKMSRRGITVDLEEARRLANAELAEFGEGDVGEEDSTFPTLGASGRTKKKSSLLTRSNTKEFQGLVAMINYSSKNSRGSEGAEGVLKRWNKISRI
jgi:hypothetical protein